MIACKIDETQQQEPPEIKSLLDESVRELALTSYGIGKFFYGEFRAKSRSWPSPVHWINELGCILWYSVKQPSRKKKTKMKIAEMVTKWKAAVVELAVAHDKDDADRVEASIEDLLTPLLTAPCDQIRQFSRLLLAELKNDKTVPYLVWAAFEVWQQQMEKAPDSEVKELKVQLAEEIVNLVKEDATMDLPSAMVRALQWRSPEKLEEVKKVVEKEKSAGRKVRLKGRESCLFLEAGGTEDKPEVCVQV